MCFSAEASFGLSAALMTGGIVSLRKAKRPEILPFATIPFIFSVQQFLEGFIWIALTSESLSYLKIPFTNLFLIWAQVVWPAWIPLSFWLMEKEKGRKRLMSLILILGLMVASFLAYCLIEYPVDVVISNHHIRYELDFAQIMGSYNGVFYFIPTVIPPMISSEKKMVLIGLLNLGSFLISKFYFQDSLVSVWCFFAAAISILIVLFMHEYGRDRPAKHNKA